jgi:hypothetical protein
MSPELVSALFAALAALLGAVAGFVAKTGLSNVITSGSERETTAVNTMAEMLDKAIDGLVRMSVSTERMGSHLADHANVSNTQWQMNREMLQSIQRELRELMERVPKDA